MKNLELTKKTDLSLFRKVALGTWQRTYDPSVYGTMNVRMDRALDYIAAFRKKHGRRLTVTHLLAKATALALQECPDANAVIRFNRIYLRKRIGVFMQVAMTDEGLSKADLSGVTIYDVEKKSLAAIADEVEQKVMAVRQRKDPALEKSRGLFRWIPFLMLNLALKLISFVVTTLNVTLPGVPRDPFGSVMITNIGTLGLDVAYVPLVPYSGVPLLLATGAVIEQAVVEGGQIKVGKVMKISATFDHRLIDGFHASVMSKVLHRCLEDPFNNFDPVE